MNYYADPRQYANCVDQTQCLPIKSPPTSLKLSQEIVALYSSLDLLRKSVTRLEESISYPQGLAVNTGTEQLKSLPVASAAICENSSEIASLSIRINEVSDLLESQLETYKLK